MSETVRLARGPRTIRGLDRRVTQCRECPRLVQWREQVARDKRASYAGETYWGRPVPSFGPDDADILVVGLAPAAHGANRTGRMFTGDRSGDWLYNAMHQAGLASQASSTRRGDGLQLHRARVTSVVKCAPPKNRPATDERDRCLPYLLRELELLPRARVIVCLGGFGFDGALRALGALGHRTRPKPKFGHAVEVEVGPYHLLCSYHPSQQNTFTGRLTRPMLQQVFDRAVQLADELAR